jgi:hypothetical protein
MTVSVIVCHESLEATKFTHEKQIWFQNLYFFKENIIAHITKGHLYVKRKIRDFLIITCARVRVNNWDKINKWRTQSSVYDPQASHMINATYCFYNSYKERKKIKWMVWYIDAGIVWVLFRMYCRMWHNLITN